MRCWEHIPDVERNGYCFSDGVGRISPALAEKAASALIRRRRRELLPGTAAAVPQPRVPSALQIRFKGYKGVLCVDTRLTGLKMQLRDSMLKFECQAADSLEVCRAAAWIPGYMNRQIITLLSCRGVPSDAIFHFQAKMTEEMDAMLNEPDVALVVLRRTGSLHKVLPTFIHLLATRPTDGSGRKLA
jgi:RNA-dependent RNA polymerase